MLDRERRLPAYGQRGGSMRWGEYQVRRMVAGMRLAGWVCARITKLALRSFANCGKPELKSSSEAC